MRAGSGVVADLGHRLVGKPHGPGRVAVVVADQRGEAHGLGKGRPGRRRRDRALEQRIRLDDLRDVDEEALRREGRPAQRVSARLSGSGLPRVRTARRRRAWRLASGPSPRPAPAPRRRSRAGPRLPHRGAERGRCPTRGPGEGRVCAALSGRACRRDRRLRQQRMREPDRSPLDGDDSRLRRRLERRRGPRVGPSQRVDGARPRSPRAGAPRVCAPAQRSGPRRASRATPDRQRLARRERGSDLQRPRDLEGIERVAARRGLDPDQDEPRKRPAEARQEQLVQAASGIGPTSSRSGPVRHPGDELEHCRPRRSPHRQQNTDPPVGEPAHRIGDDRAGRLVKPLGVVDRDQERALFGDDSEERRRRHRQGSLVRQLARRLRAEEGDLEACRWTPGSSARSASETSARRSVRPPSVSRCSDSAGADRRTRNPAAGRHRWRRARRRSCRCRRLRRSGGLPAPRARSRNAPTRSSSPARPMTSGAMRSAQWPLRPRARPPA